MSHITERAIEISHSGWRVMFLGNSLWVQVLKSLKPKEGDTVGLSCGNNLGVARIIDVIHQGSRVTDNHVACLLRFKVAE